MLALSDGDLALINRLVNNFLVNPIIPLANSPNLSADTLAKSYLPRVPAVRSATKEIWQTTHLGIEDHDVICLVDVHEVCEHRSVSREDKVEPGESVSECKAKAMRLCEDALAGCDVVKRCLAGILVDSIDSVTNHLFTGAAEVLISEQLQIDISSRKDL